MQAFFDPLRKKLSVELRSHRVLGFRGLGCPYCIGEIRSLLGGLHCLDLLGGLSIRNRQNHDPLCLGTE